MKKQFWYFIFLLFYIGTLPVQGKITLPAILSDNMVLQQKAQVRFWGKARPGEKVTVSTSWDKNIYTVQTPTDGHWEVKIKTPGVMDNQTLTVKGENTITIHNILIGEVWLCTGQSNMEFPVARDPNVKWKTVVFHHSIFSTASHVDDGDIITRRNELPQVFKDLDIDVVLMGHDHVYTRTYMMDGTTPDTSKGVQSSVTNPTGILYLTANSASGSKYYDIKAPNAEYSAKMDQSYRRTVTDIKVTDTSYTMKTYYADDLSLLDEFTIYKADNTALLNKINELKNMNLSESDYTKDSWKSFSDALTSAEELLKNFDATQDMLDASLLDLQTAYENLVKTDDQNGNDNNGNNNNGDNNNGNNNNGNNNNGNNNNGNNSGNNNANNNNNSSNKANTSAPSAKTGDITTFAPIALLLAASLSVIAFITKRRRSA